MSVAREIGDRVAIIPARGGSSRIPRKNIKSFAGKPMIVYSIDAALKAGCFDRVLVSTDDQEIALVAREAGAEVPFSRPEQISDGHSSVLEAVNHALGFLSENGNVPEYACLIYATAPFIQGADLTAAFDKFQNTAGAAFCLSAATFPTPIQRAFFKTDDDRLRMFDPAQFSTRSQDLPEALHDAAQFCWGRSEAFVDGMPIFGEHTIPYLIPRHRVQDVDTPEDWLRAERMFRASNEENTNQS